jgi:hypothetical protein
MREFKGSDITFYIFVISLPSCVKHRFPRHDRRNPLSNTREALCRDGTKAGRFHHRHSSKLLPVPAPLMRPLCRQSRAGGGESEFAVLDAFGCDQPIRKGFDSRGSSTHHQNLQAIVMIQVNMKGGNNRVPMIVLDIRERFLHVRGMMVIDQRDSSHGFSIRHLLLVLHEMVANHVRNRQRPVLVTLFSRHPAKLPEEIPVHGYTETFNALCAHSVA